MHQNDGANAGVLVLDKIEARVWQKLLQLDRPLIEGDGVQKAGWRFVIKAVTAVADKVQGGLGSVNDRTSTIEHQAVLVYPQRSLGEIVTQQFFVILPD